MPEANRNHATNLLARLVDGQADVAEELFPVAYHELRELARAFLRKEPSEGTLRATALVHEAFLRLIDFHQLDWRGQAQFGAIAARAMRSVLVDHARRKRAAKRGQGWNRITLDGLLDDASQSNIDIVQLDEALDSLEQKHERHARVVELRFFAGMARAEIAHVLDVSERTVTADLAFAQAWLRREMESGSTTLE